VLARTLAPAERLDAWIAAVPGLLAAGATVVQLPLPAMVRERADIERVLQRVATAFG
jgi:hypothetical protein